MCTQKVHIYGSIRQPSLSFINHEVSHPLSSANN